MERPSRLNPAGAPDSVGEPAELSNRDFFEEPDTPTKTQRARLKGLYASFCDPLIEKLRALYGSGPPEPGDVVQRVFEDLNSRKDLEQVRDLKAYVWVMARNRMLSEKRSEAMRISKREDILLRFYGDELDDIDPERIAMATEELQIIAAALEKMSARRRNVFLLNRIHGLNPREAGEQLGISRTAAMNHIAKAMSEIEAALDDPAKDGSVAKARSR